MNFSDWKQWHAAQINQDHVDDQARFSQLPVAAFSVAVEIIKTRQTADPSAFAQHAANLDALLEAWKPFDTRDNWQQWPREPRTFGRYHRSGDSALHVALLFAESIENALVISKVLAFGTGPLEDLDASQFEQWQQAFVDEIEQRALAGVLDDWSMAAIRRDSELLIRQVIAEARENESQRKDAEGRAVTVDQIVNALVTAGSPVKSRSAVEGWTKLADFPKPLNTRRPKTYPFQPVQKWVMQHQGIGIRWSESQVT
jgi:hypothetical protein